VAALRSQSVTIEAVRSLMMIPPPSIGRRNQGPPFSVFKQFTAGEKSSPAAAGRILQLDEPPAV
jgi:hypothetical protein